MLFQPSPRPMISRIRIDTRHFAGVRGRALGVIGTLFREVRRMSSYYLRNSVVGTAGRINTGKAGR